MRVYPKENDRYLINPGKGWIICWSFAHTSEAPFPVTRTRPRSRLAYAPGKGSRIPTSNWELTAKRP